MILIEEDKIKKLENGDFSEININDWFTNSAFDYILATINGCDKNLDFNVLNFISIYAQYLLFEIIEKAKNTKQLKKIIKIHDNIDKMSDEDIYTQLTKKYKDILIKVITIGSKHECYHKILDQLCNSDSTDIRLYCCANYKFFHFIYDPSKRVQKVAYIRYKFDQKWNNLDDNDVEKQRILFLTSALKNGVIQCYNGDVSHTEEDKMFAIFRSILFEKEVWEDNFDRDIFYTIEDKKILADSLNGLIKEGRLSFKENVMVPDYFRDLPKEFVLKK